MRKALSNRTHRAVCLLLLAASGAVAGCQNVEPKEARPNPLADPCAVRLHEISGLLLLYHARNGRFPDRLDELSPVGGPDAVPALVCPVSGLPYAYNPKGLAAAGKTGRVIVQDAEPVHSGLRWGIMTVESGGRTQVTAQVVLLSSDVVPAAGPAQ
jgi:hypothetical protein